MKFALPVTLAVLAAVASASVPAHAGNYDVSFTGVVYESDGSAPSPVGATISGQFLLIGDPGTIESFTIDGVSAPAGFTSTAALVPALTDSIYEAQVSPAVQGGLLNTTLALDLSSLTLWPSTDDASTLLADTNQLTNNLDDTVTDPSQTGFPSTFDYYIADSNGDVIAAEYANLTSINVAVPEPASFALLATSLLGFMAVRRRS